MIKTLLYTAIFTCCGLAAQAQSKPQPKPAKPAPAAKTAAGPLRFKTTWGLYLSDSLPRTAVIGLLDSTLEVRDHQNHTYTVVSFDLTYETKEPYLNDTTGQVAFYTDYTGDSFTDNRLPALWRNHLKEGLQRGETLLFNNIIIEYTGGKFYRAPELKITVR